MTGVDQTALSAQAIAERVGAAMLAEDAASRGLGMRIDAIGPGHARMSMSVRPDMLNGFKLCHGGFIATLADSAFAFACNSYNELTMAAGFTADLVAPAHEGDLLSADAVQVMRRGRTGLYDVRVSNQRGELIAVFRGRSHCIKGKQAVPL